MGLDAKELTQKIIGAAYAVHRELGAGFLENDYGNAMAVELCERNVALRRQALLSVKYRGEAVGECSADRIVGNILLCEFKALEAMPREVEIQRVNYLAETGVDIGLLSNFGKGVTVRGRFRRYERNPVNPV